MHLACSNTSYLYHDRPYQALESAERWVSASSLLVRLPLNSLFITTTMARDIPFTLHPQKYITKMAAAELKLS